MEISLCKAQTLKIKWPWVRGWGYLFSRNMDQQLWPIENGCQSCSRETEINITPPVQQELKTHHTSAT